MSTDSSLKLSRDRFLAFAFAASDMLVEVDSLGTIKFLAGAVTAVTGYEDDELVGQSFYTLFADEDQEMIRTTARNSKAKSKQGPFLLKVQNRDREIAPKNIFLSGMSLTEDGPIYFTISQADALLSYIEFNRSSNLQKIPGIDDFETLLRSRIPELVAGKKNVDVQVLQLAGMKNANGKLDANSWDGLTAAIAQLVMESSIGGDTAVKVDDEKYLLVKDAHDSDSKIQEKIKEIARRYNIEDAIDVQSKTMEGDLNALSAREASRAILYTIKKMEKGGLDAVGDDLQSSFSSFLEENTIKISNLKRIFSHQDFNLHFQPIFDMKTRKVSHHEVLVRFNDPSTTFEMITMGEDIGIAPDMDLSICRKALKYSDQNRKKKIGKIAVNLSGSSIQNDKFVTKLISALDEYPDAAKNLMFEITESSEIKDLDKVDAYIQKLRAKGYPVCLDDFGAGAASFQYLHKLKVDGIKIDGSYVRNITTNGRDSTMVKNMTQMCHEMGVYVVAEMIETQEQMDLLSSIGVDKGQGWLFGKAAPEVLPLE